MRSLIKSARSKMNVMNAKQANIKERSHGGFFLQTITLLIL